MSDRKILVGLMALVAAVGLIGCDGGGDDPPGKDVGSDTGACTDPAAKCGTGCCQADEVCSKDSLPHVCISKCEEATDKPCASNELCVNKGGNWTCERKKCVGMTEPCATGEFCVKPDKPTVEDPAGTMCGCQPFVAANNPQDPPKFQDSCFMSKDEKTLYGNTCSYVDYKAAPGRCRAPLKGEMCVVDGPACSANNTCKLHPTGAEVLGYCLEPCTTNADCADPAEKCNTAADFETGEWNTAGFCGFHKCPVAQIGQPCDVIATGDGRCEPGYDGEKLIGVCRFIGTSTTKCSQDAKRADVSMNCAADFTCNLYYFNAAKDTFEGDCLPLCDMKASPSTCGEGKACVSLVNDDTSSWSMSPGKCVTSCQFDKPSSCPNDAWGRRAVCGFDGNPASAYGSWICRTAADEVGGFLSQCSDTIQPYLGRCVDGATCIGYSDSSGAGIDFCLKYCSSQQCPFPEEGKPGKACPGCRVNVCSTELGSYFPTCTPDCSNKDCGDDGCGGICKGVVVADADACVNGKVVVGGGATCPKDCSGRECGVDACGHACGTCGGSGSCKGLGSTSKCNSFGAANIGFCDFLNSK